MVLLKSMKFWVLLVALGVFIIKTFRPDLPVSEDTLLNIVLLVLGYFHIHPEVMSLLKRE